MEIKYKVTITSSQFSKPKRLFEARIYSIFGREGEVIINKGKKSNLNYLHMYNRKEAYYSTSGVKELLR